MDPSHEPPPAFSSLYPSIVVENTSVTYPAGPRGPPTDDGDDGDDDAALAEAQKEVAAARAAARAAETAASAALTRRREILEGRPRVRELDLVARAVERRERAEAEAGGDDARARLRYATGRQAAEEEEPRRARLAATLSSWLGGGVASAVAAVDPRTVVRRVQLRNVRHLDVDARVARVVAARVPLKSWHEYDLALRGGDAPAVWDALDALAASTTPDLLLALAECQWDVATVRVDPRGSGEREHEGGTRAPARERATWQTLLRWGFTGEDVARGEAHLRRWFDNALLMGAGVGLRELHQHAGLVPHDLVRGKVSASLLAQLSARDDAPSVFPYLVGVMGLTPAQFTQMPWVRPAHWAVLLGVTARDLRRAGILTDSAVMWRLHVECGWTRDTLQEHFGLTRDEATRAIPVVVDDIVVAPASTAPREGPRRPRRRGGSGDDGGEQEPATVVGYGMYRRVVPGLHRAEASYSSSGE